MSQLLVPFLALLGAAALLIFVLWRRGRSRLKVQEAETARLKREVAELKARPSQVSVNVGAPGEGVPDAELPLETSAPLSTNIGTPPIPPPPAPGQRAAPAAPQASVIVNMPGAVPPPPPPHRPTTSIPNRETVDRPAVVKKESSFPWPLIAIAIALFAAIGYWIYRDGTQRETKAIATLLQKAWTPADCEANCEVHPNKAFIQYTMKEDPRTRLPRTGWWGVDCQAKSEPKLAGHCQMDCNVWCPDSVIQPPDPECRCR